MTEQLLLALCHNGDLLVFSEYIITITVVAGNKRKVAKYLTKSKRIPGMLQWIPFATALSHLPKRATFLTPDN